MVLNLDAINNFNESFQIMFCKEYPPQFEMDNTYKKNTRSSGRDYGSAG